MRSTLRQVPATRHPARFSVDTNPSEVYPRPNTNSEHAPSGPGGGPGSAPVELVASASAFASASITPACVTTVVLPLRPLRRRAAEGRLRGALREAVATPRDAAMGGDGAVAAACIVQSRQQTNDRYAWSLIGQCAVHHVIASLIGQKDIFGGDSGESYDQSNTTRHPAKAKFTTHTMQFWEVLKSVSEL